MSDEDLCLPVLHVVLETLSVDDDSDTFLVGASAEVWPSLLTDHLVPGHMDREHHTIFHHVCMQDTDYPKSLAVYHSNYDFCTYKGYDIFAMFLA